METFALIAAIACALAVVVLVLQVIGEIVIALTTALLGDGTGEDDRPQAPPAPVDPHQWHRSHKLRRHLEHRKARP